MTYDLYPHQQSLMDKLLSGELKRGEMTIVWARNSGKSSFMRALQEEYRCKRHVAVVKLLTSVYGSPYKPTPGVPVNMLGLNEKVEHSV